MFVSVKIIDLVEFSSESGKIQQLCILRKHNFSVLYRYKSLLYRYILCGNFRKLNFYCLVSIQASFVSIHSSFVSIQACFVSIHTVLERGKFPKTVSIVSFKP